METLHDDKNNTPARKSLAERILGSMPSFRQHMKQIAKDESTSKVESDDGNQKPEVAGYAELEVRKETIRNLDLMPDVACYDKYNLIGAVIDVKPATIFDIDTRRMPFGGDTKKESRVDAMLDSLGLKYVKDYAEHQITRDENGLDHLDFRRISKEELAQVPMRTGVSVNYYVAKDIDKAKLAQELVYGSQEELQNGNVTRELGLLLGFPETAVDFFLKRARGEVPMGSAKHGVYSGYIHSPDNFEEECRQYDEKIDYAFEKYCPHSTTQYRKLNEKMKRG